MMPPSIIVVPRSPQPQMALDGNYNLAGTEAQVLPKADSAAESAAKQASLAQNNSLSPVEEKDTQQRLVPRQVPFEGDIELAAYHQLVLRCASSCCAARRRLQMPVRSVRLFRQLCRLQWLPLVWALKCGLGVGRSRMWM